MNNINISNNKQLIILYNSKLRTYFLLILKDLVIKKQINVIIIMALINGRIFRKIFNMYLTFKTKNLML